MLSVTYGGIFPISRGFSDRLCAVTHIRKAAGLVFFVMPKHTTKR